jgi:hypothetical protein
LQFEITRGRIQFITFWGHYKVQTVNHYAGIIKVAFVFVYSFEQKLVTAGELWWIGFMGVRWWRKKITSRMSVSREGMKMSFMRLKLAFFFSSWPSHCKIIVIVFFYFVRFLNIWPYTLQRRKKDKERCFSYTLSSIFVYEIKYSMYIIPGVFC